MKIAVIASMFEKNRLRGPEQTALTLARELSLTDDVTVIASDCSDQKSKNSLTINRIKDTKRLQNDKFNVRYLRTEPFPTSLLWFLRVFNSVTSKLNLKIYDNEFYDLMHVYSTGPFTPDILKLFKSTKFDVILGSTFPSTISYLGLNSALKTKIPFIFAPYYHYFLPEFKFSKVLRNMIKRSRAIVANTEYEKNELIKIGSEENKTFTVPSPFDTTITDKINLSKDEAKRKLSLDSDFIVMAPPMIGKGADIVMHAVDQLSVMRGEKVALLTIGEPDFLYSKFKKRTLQKNKNLKIIDLGWVDETDKWLAYLSSDLFAMPSKSDSFGLQYLEAWALSKPVVGLTGTTAECIIDNNKNGWLIDSANSLFALLTWGIENIDKLPRFGDEGYVKLKNEYSPKLFVYRYRKIIERILE